MPYTRPNWFVTNVGNKMIGLLVRLGMQPSGANLLTVPGRRSGKPRTTPVNPLEHNGARYLVAPRGETEWARNLRAAGEGELRVGGKAERIRVTEVAGEEKPPVIRAYLDRWYGFTGAYFGVAKDAPDEELRRIAPEHPVFRIAG